MSTRVTQQEREEMLRLRVNEGMNNIQIARAVGRAVTCVTRNVGRNDSIPATAKWRDCLGCQKRFLSEGAGNRLCVACRKAARYMSASLEL